MKIIDIPCRNFIEELSSKSAIPGGGGAAALDGAMGAALLSMVCNLTIGKKRYVPVSYTHLTLPTICSV